MLNALVGTGHPCTRCLRLAFHGEMRLEAIQPVPERPLAPLAKDGSGPCCYDCQLADTLVALGYVPEWKMARTAVANCRQEQLRLPGAPIGFVQMGLMRPNAEGDLALHHAWLQGHGLVER